MWWRLTAISSRSSGRILDGARLCRGDNEGRWRKGTKGLGQGSGWVMEDRKHVEKRCFPMLLC